MVDEAVDVYEFVMNKAMSKYNVKDISGIKKITEEVIPFLAKIENSVIRDVWAKKLAEKLDVDVTVVKSEIERTKTGKSKETVIEKIPEQEMQSKIVKLTNRLISSLLTNSEIRAKVKDWMKGVSLEGASGKVLVWVLNSEETDPVVLRQKAPAELKATIEEAYMEDEQALDEKMIQMLVLQLIREIIREKRKILIGELKKVKEGGHELEEDRISVEINDLDRQESKVLLLLS